MYKEVIGVSDEEYAELEKAGAVTDALKIQAGMRATVPVEEEHRTYAIRKFTDNGDAITERSIGIYRNGKLVKAK